jgi:hypothetical protein
MVFQTSYHIGKIGLFFIAFLPYLQWKTWRAKSAFRDELLKNGVPREVAANLADSYGKENRGILGSILKRSSGVKQLVRASDKPF